MARNGQLTKPPGALGRLEDLAIWFAGWQGRDRPRCDRPQVLIFAGNHGVVAQGVSAFPAEVTGQMVANFRAGGAAINQLSKAFGATMSVHELSLDRPTADFTQAPAMSEAEVVAALATGWTAVDPEADALVRASLTERDAAAREQLLIEAHAALVEREVYIPLGAVHRMENPGKVNMVLIEVQTGSYLGEDDIIRYEDVYARK